jgi:hypothetical protein
MSTLVRLRASVAEASGEFRSLVDCALLYPSMACVDVALLGFVVLALSLSSRMHASVRRVASSIFSSAAATFFAAAAALSSLFFFSSAAPSAANSRLVERRPVAKRSHGGRVTRLTCRSGEKEGFTKPERASTMNWMTAREK